MRLTPLVIIRICVYSALIALAMLVKCTKADAQTLEQLQLITKEANKYHVDPSLALAVAEVESKFNSNAVGSLGERGLFQLRPEFHTDAVGSGDRANIAIGVRYLALCRRLCRPALGDAWVACFNYGPSRARRLTDAHNTEYYRKVNAALSRRKLAANGR